MQNPDTSLGNTASGTSEGPPSTLKAVRLFDALDREATLRCDVEDDIETILGLDTETPWPYEDYTYDSYDWSVEFKRARVGWKPTDSQVRAILDLGFQKFWICYTNGAEMYYSIVTVEGHFKPAPPIDEASVSARSLVNQSKPTETDLTSEP